MKQYIYRTEEQRKILAWQVVGILSLFLSAPLYLPIFVSLFFIPLSPEDYLLIPGCGLTLLLFSLSVSSFFVNYYPRIWVDEESLSISFFFLFRIKIYWREIIDIQETQWFTDRAMLVRVKKVMPFHIFYGLFYANKFYSGFLFMKSIQDADTLIREIRWRVQENKVRKLMHDQK